METKALATTAQQTNNGTQWVSFWADSHHKIRMINMPFCPAELDSIGQPFGWIDQILSEYCTHLEKCGLCRDKVQYLATADRGNTGDELINRDTSEFEDWCREWGLWRTAA